MMRILFSILCLFILLSSFSVIAKKGGGGGGASLTTIDCSSDKYTAKINEVNLASGQFIEIYFTSAITTSNWDICYLNDSGSEVCSSSTTRVPANASYSSGDFAVFTVPSDMDTKDGEILLKDSGGDAIDSLTYCNGSSCSNEIWDFNSSCTTTFTNHAPGQTDMYRDPDGTGSFDNNKTTTEGCSNSGCGGGGGGDTAATGFNCVESGTDGISGNLYTKTTAQSFSFDVIALQDASTVETNFASGADHEVTVELVDTTSGASCAAYSALSSFSSHNITFTSADLGTLSSSTLTPSSSKAYSSVKCRITDTTDSVVGCSTDSFTIRPTALAITSTMTNTGSTATPVAKTGENFEISATAETGYTGTPQINNSNIEAHAGANQTGTITGSFSPAASGTGIATGSSFNYSEVGSLRFLAEGVYDDTFSDESNDVTNGDCTDNFSNSVVSGKVGCKFGNTSTSAYFGRFTPDHFDVTLNTPVFTPACSTFSYIGQSLIYATNPVATVTAKNASDLTTQNYTGDFWKIDPTDGTYGFSPTYTEASHTLTVLESSPPSVTDNGDGTGLLNFSDTSTSILGINKGSLVAPFNAEIALGFTLSDTDAIVVANVDGSAQTNPVSFGAASSGNGISFSSGNKTQRWGRVALDQVQGSELSNLNMPVYTEYYDGSNFITNTADNCTNFTLATDFSISDPADFNCTFSTQTSPVSIGSGSVKATMSNTTVTSGTTVITISDNSDTSAGSGSGNTGYLEITSKLTNLPWLLYDWDTDSNHDNCPSAKAIFGLSTTPGINKPIYFREVY